MSTGRGLGIDLDDHRVDAARRAAALGPEVRRALEARARCLVGRRRAAGSPSRRARRGSVRARVDPAILTRPPASSNWSSGAPSRWLARCENLVSHLDRRGMTRGAGHRRAAARERARAPMELARIAGDDADLLDVDAEHLGDELREHREVALSLCPDAGRARARCRSARPSPARLHTDRCRCPRHSTRRRRRRDALRRAAAAALRAGTARSQSSRPPARASAGSCRCRRRAAPSPET